MKISRVWAVYFSPTGNVKEVTNLIAKKLSEELSVPLEQWDFTLPDNRKSAKAFEKEDLVVFGTPVYAGRVPNKILPWVQQGFTGDHTPMVPVVVFGNRNFDDALMELKQELDFLQRQVRLWQAAMYFLIRLHRADRMHQIGQKF